MRKIRLRGDGVKNGEWVSRRVAGVDGEEPDDSKYIKIGNVTVSKRDLALTIRSMAITDDYLPLFVREHAEVPLGERVWLYPDRSIPMDVVDSLRPVAPRIAVSVNYDSYSQGYTFVATVQIVGGPECVTAYQVTREAIEHLRFLDGSTDEVTGYLAAQVAESLCRGIDDILHETTQSRVRELLVQMIRRPLTVRDLHSVGSPI